MSASFILVTLCAFSAFLSLRLFLREMRRKNKQQLLRTYTIAIRSVEIAEDNLRSAVENTPRDKALECIRRSILTHAKKNMSAAQKAWEEY